MNRRFLAPLLALAVAVSPSTAGTDQGNPRFDDRIAFEDTGPLRIRDQFLAGMGYLSLEPSGAKLVRKGQWQIDFVQSGTNTWLHSRAVERFLGERREREPLTLSELQSIPPSRPGKGIYFLDGELHRSSVSARFGVLAGLQASITIPVVNFQGGFGDRPIQGFHRNFGFSQNGRLDVPRNGYTIYVRDGEGHEVFLDEDPGVGLGDIDFGLKASIPVPGEAWRVAVEGTVKTPTGSEKRLYGSGAIDYGAQILAARYFSRSCLHLGGGVARLGRYDLFELAPQVVFSGMVGYEYAFTARTTGIAQITISESPFEDLEVEKLDEVAFLIDVGLKRAFGEQNVFFAALTENFVKFGSSLDVGIHVGYTKTFSP